MSSLSQKTQSKRNCLLVQEICVITEEHTGGLVTNIAGC